MLHQLAQAFGQVARQVSKADLQPPAACFGTGFSTGFEQAAPHQVVDEGDDEQRIAFGAAVHERCQRLGRGVGELAEAPPQQRSDGGHIEQPERQLARLVALRQVRCQAVQRRLAVPRIGGPEAGHDQQTCRLRATGDERQRGQRRRVAPVQIFQPQHQRSLRGQHLKGLGDLAQHALRGAQRAGLRLCLRQRRPGQPRQLRQPAGRIAGQQLAQRAGTDLRGQVLQGFQQRQEGLAGAVLLDAAALRRPQLAGAGLPLEEGRDQGRLADASLASDEHQLAPAAAGRSERCVEESEFALAREQAFWPCCRRCRQRRFVRSRRRRLLAVHSSDEAQAHPVHGGDETWRRGVVAEDDTQLADGPGQSGVADHGAGPHRLKQLGLGEELARPGQQRRQQREGLARDRDRLPVAAQLVLGGIGLEGPETP